MPINVDQFAGVLPSGNFFSDPRLPNNLQSSGARYTPNARPSPVAGGGGGGLGGGAPALPDFSEIGNLIGQINATNQAAQHAANAGRIPGASQLEQLSSNSIAGLLNPPTQIGEIDTGAAARALGSGTSGSPFAGHMGIVLNENERIRRQGIGQQFLTSALARNPAAPIADPQQLLQFIQQQRFQADQAARNRDFEGQQNALNRAMPRLVAPAGVRKKSPNDSKALAAPAAACPILDSFCENFGILGPSSRISDTCFTGGAYLPSNFGAPVNCSIAASVDLMG